MKSTVNSLRMLLGFAAVAMLAWLVPLDAFAASCGKAQFASGPHLLATPAQRGAAIANLSSGTTILGTQRAFEAGSIVGLWHTVYTSGGATAFESFEQWHADGNEFEAADLQLGALCQGTWVKLGPGTVKLLHVGWNFDPTGVTLVGYFTEIQVNTLAADGKTYDGTFAIQNFDLAGNHLVGQDLNGTTHATRFTVP